jgi:hypothetical protein
MKAKPCSEVDLPTPNFHYNPLSMLADQTAGRWKDSVYFDQALHNKIEHF